MSYSPEQIEEASAQEAELLRQAQTKHLEQRVVHLACRVRELEAELANRECCEKQCCEAPA